MTLTVAANNRCILCRPHSRKVVAPANLPGLTEVFARLKSPSILGGNAARADAGRFSYWAAEPREVFTFAAAQTSPFERLTKVLTKYSLTKDCADVLPKGIFRGGWIGYFSYELGRYIEKLPATTADDLEMPLIRLCFCDRLIAYDHLDDVFWFIALQLPDEPERPEDKLAALEQLFAEAQRTHVPQPLPVDLENVGLSQVRCNMDKRSYLRAVRRIKRYIYDGDVYQINFSQRFDSAYSGRAVDLFHWQNHYNPSGYAAYIDTGDFQIISASPEMFITIDDRFITTKPIKGTRPRITSTNAQAERVNAQNVSELALSPKEKAELNMIIDLERNDLARICRPGTRRVTEPRSVEAHPTVFHAVATVGGKLRPDVGFCDILKAMFPGGSITGAPKIRAMEIIDETEPTARGVYTGSIGAIGLDGAVCLNIAIRTTIITHGRAFAQAGGGIVADSDPQAEWDETITKARALLAGIRANRQP